MRWGRASRRASRHATAPRGANGAGAPHGEVALAAVELLRRHHGDGSSVEVVALAGVDLELVAGELCLLQGPSGSGKTTLVELLAGFDEPTSGTVLGVRDEHLTDVTGLARPWPDLAVVPQALGLLDELTLRENIALPLRLRGPLGDVEEQAVTDVIERLGLALAADRVQREASLGEQQRAAIGRALLVQPRALLVDEPTAHQDAGNRARVVGALRDAADNGAAVLAATHDEHLRSLAQRVVTMRDGRIVGDERLDVAAPRDAW